MLTPYHERRPSYRLQQYVPGVPLDPDCNVEEREGRLYLHGRLRVINPGDWVAVDSEGFVMIMTDSDAHARFDIPPPASPHVGSVAGLLTGTPTPDVEPPSSFTAAQREEIEQMMESILLARFGPW